MRDQNQGARFLDNYGDSCRKRPLSPATDNESAQTRCLPCNTLHPRDRAGKLFVLIFVRLVCALLLDSVRGFKEFVMQTAITAMAVIAGMILSLAVALLAEELIFGQVFRLFFARQAVQVKSGQKR